MFYSRPDLTGPIPEARAFLGFGCEWKSGQHASAMSRKRFTERQIICRLKEAEAGGEITQPLPRARHQLTDTSLVEG